MQKWEYKTVKFKTKGFGGGILDSEKYNEQLNKLGDDGWELISSFTTNQMEGITREVIAVLKKLKA